MIKIFYIEIYQKSSDKKEKENIIIYGAGVSGLITKRTIDKDINSNFKIVGFIDDSIKLKNTRLQGVKIYHSRELKTLIKKHNIKTIIIAIQNPDYENKL